MASSTPIFAKLNHTVKINLAIQALCLCIGTYTHVDWVMHHGFLYSDLRYSIYSQLFWDSLTFLDPLAALLLFIAPKKGMWLTFIIIIVDVVHNAIISSSYRADSIGHWIIANYFLTLQIAFCIFVVASLRMNTKEINRVSRK